MKILGVETSCDETAVAVVQSSAAGHKALANIISSQVKLHSKYGGVVPNLAAREHTRNLDHVFKLALEKAKIKKIKEIDLIAVTSGPGLVSSLLIGTAFAKTLAWLWDKPIVGVNHLEGHIYSNWLTDLKNSKIFPALNLVVSGGHTQLVLMTNHGKYKLIGETRDDAAGEAFDKIARILGLGYPGGPAIAMVAARIKGQRPNIEISLPRPMIDSKNFDFSFSGLKTAVLYLVHDFKNKYPLKKIRPVVSREAQNAIVDVLVSKTIRAAEKFNVKSVLLSGGVSANKLLREELEKNLKIDAPRVTFFKPNIEYTTDNAAMIAVAGYYNYIFGNKKSWKNIKVDANKQLA